MASHHPIRKVVAPAAPVIPDKLYFRIGDVARLCEVPAYVLRFWETEFPNLKPNKGGTGQRLYRKRDVETALRIKHLLYDLGYTIPGARQAFKADAARAEAPPASSAILSEPRSPEQKAPDAAQPAAALNAFPAAAPKLTQLHALRDELRALHSQLASPVSPQPAIQPKPLRPRLVTETKQKPALKLEPRLEFTPGPVALPGQQALFPTE